jgi:hypothetical protein
MADEVLVNSGGSTRRQRMADFGRQLVGSGAIPSDYIQALSWANLTTFGGATGRGAEVSEGTDAGTHVDPVTGATVPNEGIYQLVAGTGWRRIGAPTLSRKA